MKIVLKNTAKYLLSILMVTSSVPRIAKSQTIAANLTPALKPIIVRSGRMNSPEFRGVVRSLTLENGLNDFVLFNDRYQQAEREFLETFAEAQKEFLSGSKDRAAELFETLVGKRLERTWSESVRNVLSYCILRRAQLAKPDQVNSWLDAFISFDPNGKVDTKLFPPPLVGRLAPIQEQLLSRRVRWRLPLSADYETVFVDSRPYEIRHHGEIELLPGTHRIELISSMRTPVFIVADPEDLNSWRPLSGDIWVSGTCKDAHLQESLKEAPRVIAAVSADCWREFEFGIAKGVLAGTNINRREPIDKSAGALIGREPGSAPTSLPPKLDLRANPGPEFSNPSSASKKSNSDTGLNVVKSEDVAPEVTKKWYQQKWVWLVAGAVVLGSVAALTFPQTRSTDGGSVIERPVHR